MLASHIQWYVGNAKQADSYYFTRMGFRPMAYRGPETGSPNVARYVVANGAAVFIPTGPVCSLSSEGAEDSTLQGAIAADWATVAAIHEYLAKHGSR